MSRIAKLFAVVGAALSLPQRVFCGPVSVQQEVFFPPWAVYPVGHPHASDTWRTVAGLRWWGFTANRLRLRAVRTGNGDVLLGISQHVNGRHHSKPLCTVPEGSVVRVRIEQHRDGHLSLSVRQGGKLRGCHWYQLPATQVAVGHELRI